MRILVADDDPGNLDIMGRLFIRLGAEVELARDGRAAAALAAASVFDLILLDLAMPGRGGRMAAQDIRRGEAARGWRRAPILALSGSDAENVLADPDFDGFIQKPVSMAALKEMVERWSKEGQA